MNTVHLDSRRSFFRRAGGVGTAAYAGIFVTAEDYEAVAQTVKTASQPSQLKITDLRVCRVGGHWVVRLDTNQGLHGYGEVRDGASPTYALMLSLVEPASRTMPEGRHTHADSTGHIGRLNRHLNARG